MPLSIEVKSYLIWERILLVKYLQEQKDRGPSGPQTQFHFPFFVAEK
jgi:hypothetical protein